MNRSEIIDLVVIRSSGTPGELRKLRQELSEKPTEELEEIHHQILRAAESAEIRARVDADPEHQRLRDETLREYHLAQIFRTVIPGRGVPVRNQASETIILSWLNLDEVLSRDWFIKVIQGTPALANQLTWKKQIPETELRQKFAVVCRQLQIAQSEGNFSLVRDRLSETWPHYIEEVRHVVESGIISLSSATQEEIDKWSAEAHEEHVDFLIKPASPGDLRQAASTEFGQRRAQAQQQEAQRQVQAAIARDSGISPIGEPFPPLPETWQGQKLDAAFIKICSADTQRLLQKRFGSGALNRRLQGN